MKNLTNITGTIVLIVAMLYICHHQYDVDGVGHSTSGIFKSAYISEIFLRVFSIALIFFLIRQEIFNSWASKVLLYASFIDVLILAMLPILKSQLEGGVAAYDFNKLFILILMYILPNFYVVKSREVR